MKHLYNRKDARLRYLKPAKYQYKNQELNDIEIININNSGAKLKCNQIFERYDVIYLHILNEAQEYAMIIKSEIMWQRNNIIGVKFYTDEVVDIFINKLTGKLIQLD